MFTKNQKGQTLILMLIVTVISLTIGVAISSRAVSTLRQTSYTAQAGKAQKFSDAGIEHALPDPGSLLGCTALSPCELDLDGGGADVEYTVTQSGDGPSIETDLERDQTVEVDLYDPDTGTRYPSNRDIKIYWVEEGSSEDRTQSGTVDTEAAIVVALIYNEGGQTKIAKYAFDANEADRGNNFSAPGTTGGYTPVVGGPTYKYEAAIANLGMGDYEALRIRPLYNTVTNTAVVTNDGVLGTFPTQGYKITSTGTYGEAEWTAEVTKMNPALPAIFDFAIFSESDLTK